MAMEHLLLFLITKKSMSVHGHRGAAGALDVAMLLQGPLRVVSKAGH
jgi:hypothetical protein